MEEKTANLLVAILCISSAWLLGTTFLNWLLHPDLTQMEVFLTIPESIVLNVF